MNPNQSPSLSRPRDRYQILDDLRVLAMAAYHRGDSAGGDRLYDLALRASYQVRHTRLANRLSPR